VCLVTSWGLRGSDLGSIDGLREAVIAGTSGLWDDTAAKGVVRSLLAGQRKLGAARHWLRSRAWKGSLPRRRSVSSRETSTTGVVVVDLGGRRGFGKISC